MTRGRLLAVATLAALAALTVLMQVQRPATPVVATGTTIASPDTAGNVGTDTSIALDGAGNPIVTYFGCCGSILKVLHCGNPACTAGNAITSPDTSGTSFTSLALDAAGHPVISYNGCCGSGGVLHVLHCGNSSCTAGNSNATPDTPNAGGDFSSLKLDAAGNPVVSYRVDGGRPDPGLKLLHCGNATCTSGNTIATPDVPVEAWTSLALDSTGKPVIGYYAGGTTLRVIHCSNVNCSGVQTISSPDTTTAYHRPSLALDASDNPVLSYYDQTNGALRVLHCGDATCTAGNSIVALDAGSNGGYSSLALDLSGNPVISYYGTTGLKVLHCGNANCTAGNVITAPDTAGNVGLYTSLILDAAGHPVVSYYDQTNGDLKVLHCGDPNCSGVAKPTPTPKPAASGTLSGVYDFQLSTNGGTTSLYQCIYRLDQYASGGTYADGKSATQCYATDGTSAGDPNGLPGHGTFPAIGPPPPPPYNLAAPAKGLFSVTAGPILTAYTCFPNVGGTQGPNIITKLTISDPLGQLNTNGKQVGDVNIYPNQGITQCDSVLAGSPSPTGSPTVLAGDGYAFLTDSTDSRCTSHGSCVLAPWRSPSSPTKLYSTNVCTDSHRLWQDKAGSLTTCGDDPWNPNDVEYIDSPDVNGSSGLYYIQATVTRADACWGGTSASNPAFCAAKPDGTLVPGFYLTCDADILQGTQISPIAGANQLLARTFCYLDSPSFTVNPDAVPGNTTTCPSAAAQYCGDGLLGSAPPGCSLGSSCAGTRPDQVGGCTGGYTGCHPTYWQFSHIHLASGSTPRHTELTGMVDTVNNLLDLSGCFVDDTGHGAFGNVYAAAKLNLHTGHGYVATYGSQTLANCTAGTPTGAPTLSPEDAVRQATDTSTPSRETFDSSGGGCPDVSKLSANPATGGLRDPFNPYDYFDALRNGRVRVDDVLAIVKAYGTNQGDVGYNANYDRSVIGGSNPWNLGPGNGQIRINDIVAEILQAFHDCPSTSPTP